MTEKYEFDFKPFDKELLKNIPLPELITAAEATLAKFSDHYVVNDMLNSYKKNATLTDSQIDYLGSLVKEELAAYKEYEKKFFEWFDSRPDIREIYEFGVKQGYVYFQNVGGVRGWTHKGSQNWQNEWDIRPPNVGSFWRVTNDWNVRRFKEVNRECTFEEGDLVVLRKPHIYNWRYDPLYNGSTTPDKAVERIGTVMQRTEELSRNSRAGKGSRLINVLWIGCGEIKSVPERIIKLHERKRKKRA